MPLDARLYIRFMLPFKEFRFALFDYNVLHCVSCTARVILTNVTKVHCISRMF